MRIYMKLICKIFKVFFLSFIAMLSTGTQADDYYVDDIAIYKSTDQQATDKKVIILLDTSTSMSKTIAGGDTSDPSQTRIYAIQQALTQVINEVNDNTTKIGLARTTQPGAAILFPIQSVTAGASTSAASVIVSSAEEDNDVFEINADGDANFESGTQKETGTLPLFSGCRTLESGEQECGTTQIGLRFENIDVPQGATVEYAAIKFTPDSSYTLSGNEQWQVFVEQAPNSDAEPFSSDIDNKTWNPTTATDQGTIYEMQVTSLVNDIVQNQQQWCKGNDMAFKIEGTGEINVYAYEGTTDIAQRPTLYVKYRGMGNDQGNNCRDSLTVGEQMIDAINNTVPAADNTLTGALFETFSYLIGENVYYGKNRGTSADTQYTRISYDLTYDQNGSYNDPDGNCASAVGTPNATQCADESIIGDPLYISPLSGTGSCGETVTSLIYITAKAPEETATEDRDYVASQFAQYSQALGTEVNCDAGSTWDCADKITNFMLTSDLKSGSPTDKVKTYVIQLSTEDDVGELDFNLQQLTDEPNGGRYYPNISNSNDLASRIREVINNSQGGGSATQVGTAVNLGNRSQHRDDLYYGLFSPTSTIRWEGNLRLYRLSETGSEQDIQIIIDDQLDDDTAAIDDNGIADNSCSFWLENCDNPDGDTLTEGGMIAQMPDFQITADNPLPPIFTDRADGTGSNPIPLVSNGDALNRLDDAGGETALQDDISASEVGALGNTNPVPFGIQCQDPGSTQCETDYKDAIYDWMQRVDVLDEDGDGQTINDARREVGSFIHSRPVLAQLGSANVIYVSDNDGYLWAVNADPDHDDGGGETLFGFTPQALMPYWETWYANEQPVAANHLVIQYGLDSSPVLGRFDNDKDGIISTSLCEPDDGVDAMRLYMGMGRGGHNYYALDVTKVCPGAESQQPELLFRIENVGDYSNLGYTTSVPILKKVLEAGETEATPVMIFAGGYDSCYDAAPPTCSGDVQGSEVYIVNAVTGELLSKINHSEMTCSIPGAVASFDSDDDDDIDYLYFADLCGQVWRADIPEAGITTDSLTAHLFAELGKTESASAENDRYFFHAPALAEINYDSDGVDGYDTSFIAVALGSGKQHFLNDTAVHDRFYVLRDFVPTGASTSFDDDEAITHSALVDVTTEYDNPSIDTSTSRGIYIELIEEVEGQRQYEGHKVTGEAVIFDEAVLFSVYRPSIDSCSSTGESKLFAMNATSGLPTHLDGTLIVGATSYDSRMKGSDIAGFVSGPAIAMRDKQRIAIISGTEVETGVVSPGGVIDKRSWQRREVPLLKPQYEQQNANN